MKLWNWVWFFKRIIYWSIEINVNVEKHIENKYKRHLIVNKVCMYMFHPIIIKQTDRPGLMYICTPYSYWYPAVPLPWIFPRQIILFSFCILNLIMVLQHTWHWPSSTHSFYTLPPEDTKLYLKNNRQWCSMWGGLFMLLFPKKRYTNKSNILMVRAMQPLPLSLWLWAFIYQIVFF